MSDGFTLTTGKTGRTWFLYVTKLGMQSGDAGVVRLKDDGLYEATGKGDLAKPLGTYSTLDDAVAVLKAHF